MEALALFWILAQAAAPAAEAAVTAERLKVHVEVLASDAMEGRNAGTEGNVKAGDYIAGRLKEWGLKPGGGKDDYFQPFEFFDQGRRVRTRNVLALVEGRDPKLKEELVVLGAHYDHVGTVAQEHSGQAPPRDKADTIYNGADDNASGSAVLMGVALALAQTKTAGRRSVLLIWFSGEESGLYGSKHYVEQPIRPLERHVAMFNLDMVGRNEERPVAIGGVGSDRDGALAGAVERAVRATGLAAEVRGFGEVKMDVSDHHPFYERRVPTLMFFTGFHDDYHNVTDHADRIAYGRMEQIGRTALRAALELADREEGWRFREPRPPGLRRRRVDLEDAAKLGLAEGRGAVEVRSVQEGSAEARGGILPGDHVVAVGGRPLPAREAHKAFDDWLESARPGVPHAVEVIRGGERRTLTLEWAD